MKRIILILITLAPVAVFGQWNIAASAFMSVEGTVKTDFDDGFSQVLTDDTKTYEGYIQASYGFQVLPKVILQPLFGLGYAHTKVKDSDNGWAFGKYINAFAGVSGIYTLSKIYTLAEVKAKINFHMSEDEYEVYRLVPFSFSEAVGIGYRVGKCGIEAKYKFEQYTNLWSKDPGFTITDENGNFLKKPYPTTYLHYSGIELSLRYWF